jgi:hypothetical protein
MDRPVKAPSAAHNNSDLLVWACYQCGGFDRWIDVEEVYLKAFELAPKRLAWRTREDLPDYKKCAKALQELEDPKRSDHLGLVGKQTQYLRKLTPAGKEWCEKYRDALAALYGGGSVPASPTQDPSRLIRHVESTAAFGHFKRTGNVGCELWQIAETLRCLVDSSQTVWMARIDAVASAAERTARSDAREFAQQLRQMLPQRSEFQSLSR